MTKVLAVLLLLVAGALVFTVIQQHRKQTCSDVDQSPSRGRSRNARTTSFRRRRAGDDRRVRQVLALGRPRHEPRGPPRKNLMSLNETEILRRASAPGFVWDSDGSHRDEISCRTRGRSRVGDAQRWQLPTRRPIVGVEPNKDLAVLHIDAPACEAAADSGRFSRRRSGSARRCSRSAIRSAWIKRSPSA